MSERHPAAVNAELCVQLEDELRSWPYQGQTHDMDKRARKAGLQMRNAPEHAKERAFRALWWIRFAQEPTIADLYRVGVPFDEAEARMDKRLDQFERAFYGRP